MSLGIKTLLTIIFIILVFAVLYFLHKKKKI